MVHWMAATMVHRMVDHSVPLRVDRWVMSMATRKVYRKGERKDSTRDDQSVLLRAQETRQPKEAHLAFRKAPSPGACPK